MAAHPHNTRGSVQTAINAATNAIKTGLGEDDQGDEGNPIALTWTWGAALSLLHSLCLSVKSINLYTM